MMDNREKKRWLLRWRDTARKVDLLEEERRSMMELLTKVTPSYSQEGGGSGSHDPHKFDRVMNYVEEIDDAITRLAVEKQEVMHAIDTLTNPDEWEVMTARYISGNRITPTWESIAERLHWSQAQVYIIHGRALQNIQIIE